MRRPGMRRVMRRGFSLTELLVVVAVILILVALLIVSVQGVYAQATQLRCQQHLEQIGQALSMYLASSHGRWVPVWDMMTGRSWFQLLTPRFLSDPAVLGCPSVGEPPLALVQGTPGQQQPKREQADTLWKVMNWLKSKQNASGGTWPITPSGVGAGWTQSVTGLSTLAMLGYGCTDKKPPEFAPAVRAAVQYLSSSAAQNQDSGPDQGKFRQTGCAIYNQGICVMALAAAAQTIEDPTLRAQAARAAQLGVNWMVSAQNQADYGCFTYSTPYSASTDPHFDTNATCWFYHAAAAARDSGLSVPDSVFTKAEEFFYWSYDIDGDAFYWTGAPNTRSGAHSSSYPAATPARLATGLVMGHSPGASDSVTIAEYLYKNNYPTAQLAGLESKTPHESHTYATYFANEAMVRMGGKYLDKWRQSYFPQGLMAVLDPVDDTMSRWTNRDCHDSGGSWSDRGEWGDIYATAMACMALEVGYSDYWLAVPGTPPVCAASYGYNNALRGTNQTPAGDTIVVMDYQNWTIDRDNIDTANNDDDSQIAPRHGGRANILFGDGSVRPMLIQDIKAGMWTPKAGD